MIKWIFFDVGNVIFNDDPWMAVILERIYDAILLKGHCLSVDEFFSEREDLINNKQDGAYWRTIAKKYLGKDGWNDLKNILTDELEENYLKYHILFPGIKSVLDKLWAKYNLAIAANQSTHCRKFLAQKNLLKHFDVIGISSEIGLEKPSCDFFTYLLNKAECLPHEAVMVGDRIDNDISPAKKVGMRTIWVRIEPQNKGYKPKTDFAKRYFQSMSRTPLSQYDPNRQEDQPDVTVSTIEDICAGINSIDITPVEKQKQL